MVCSFVFIYTRHRLHACVIGLFTSPLLYGEIEREKLLMGAFVFYVCLYMPRRMIIPVEKKADDTG